MLQERKQTPLDPASYGHGLVKIFEPIETTRLRLYVQRKEGPPGIAEWQVYAPDRFIFSDLHQSEGKLHLSLAQPADRSHLFPPLY